MKLKSIFLGIATIAVLMAVLVATRMMVLTEKSDEFKIREIETVSLPEPPPPAPEETSEDIPPPPPALLDLRMTQDVDQPALPVVAVNVDPRLAVDTFFTDQLPAPLPTVRRPKPAPVVVRSVKTPSKPRLKRPPPRAKSRYSLSELDQKPRLLRNPSVSFPRSIKTASRGRVVVRVVIQTSGKSRYLSLVSSTHPALISLARRIANGSRFTPPTRHGKPVKAIMTWPIIIKK